MSVGIYSVRHDCRQLMYVDMSRCTFYEYGQKESFFKATHEFKIAVIEPNYKDTSNLHNELLEFSQCDLVIVFSMELTDKIYQAICNCDKPNYKFVVNGVLNFPLQHAEFITDSVWFYSTGYFYHTQNVDLLKTKLFPFKKKDYLFDVMYGQTRPHRSFVQSYINSMPGGDLFYQTPYFQPDRKLNIGYNFDNTDLWEDEIIPSPDIDYYCTYLDTTMCISQVIPFKIYNKTCYSLVCETRYDNEFSFFTEKTAKAILSHRLFIIISGQWALRNLRSLGFKTFDSIIDESYDGIADNHQRWTAALEQARWLCKQDCNTIFKKIIPIVTHNFEVLKNIPTNILVQVLEKELLVRGYHH